MKTLTKYKVEIFIVTGFALMLLFVFACYYFDFELMDMT